MPMKTCADTSGRIASSVTPSAASSTSRTAAVAPGQPPVALAAARAQSGAHGGDATPSPPLAARRARAHRSGHG